MTEKTHPPPTADYEVEIYGPPGAGKTLLLAALYQNLPQDGTPEISNELGQLHQRLVQDLKLPGRTKLGVHSEWLTFQLSEPSMPQPIKVQVTAHAGEELEQRRREEIKQEFQDNCTQKLLVVVVNPFLHHPDLAWKAFRNLIAVLQSKLGLPIKEACYAAANILFQVSRENFIPAPLTPKIGELFDSLKGVQLEYNHYEPNLEKCFTLNNDIQNSQVYQQFNTDLKQIVTGIVQAHQPIRDRLRGMMTGLDNSMVILSHADLMDLLPALKWDDFDDVFNSIFDTPNRNYRRQLLAHNIRLAINPRQEAGEDQTMYYVYPAQVLSRSAKQFYENIKSFAIEAKKGKSLSGSQVQSPNKLHWVTPEDAPLIRVTENLVSEAKLNREELSKLVTATTNLVKEVELNLIEFNPKQIAGNMETISKGFSNFSMLEVINSNLTKLANKLKMIFYVILPISIIWGIFIVMILAIPHCSRAL
ncbi:MAG: ATP-binding protein [Candidatus Parabeggiatoa sp.]|nr:ATP-binding protein [Candidatus Parabeggiatoa sp.]